MAEKRRILGVIVLLQNVKKPNIPDFICVIV